MGKVTGPIQKAEVKELLGAISDVPWQWVKATDLQLRADGATESQLKERREAIKDEAWEELKG